MQKSIVKSLVRHHCRRVSVLLTFVLVVVLGGDTPYALPAILELEKKGYIVIASVSNSAAIDLLESQCKGYVKAHVLDPFEVCNTCICTTSSDLHTY